MLNWANRFNIFCFLDNQDYSVQPQQYECLLGAGALSRISADRPERIDAFLSEKKGWAFGHLSYDLKNALHHLEGFKEDKIGFPPFFFFEPEFMLRLRHQELVVEGNDPETVFREIMEQEAGLPSPVRIRIEQRLTREAYMEKISQLQQHILRGDCYEINFCQEFFARDVSIRPVEIFEKLTGLSPNPFSALYRLDDHYLICASPERFLVKKGNRIYSQPMKGTIKRDPLDPAADEALKNELRQSAKDRSENVMVVDMVRNDLSRICSESSVAVDELFGVYTYPHVHQMISTISGDLRPDVRFSEIVEASFPMGSMTGAPKHRVMELIEEYEPSARGIFSGSVGYFSEDGDFDFNVVIRSIMYNASTGYLSYQVGSGITFYSDPAKEWEECLLKGEAIKKVLTS